MNRKNRIHNIYWNAWPCYTRDVRYMGAIPFNFDLLSSYATRALYSGLWARVIHTYSVLQDFYNQSFALN
jgi:hypothetical protein